MKKKEALLAGLVILVAVMIFAARFMVKHHPPPGDLRGKSAPEFTLKTLEGKTVKLADYRGQAVLVNFWATWCHPCKIEMPWFVELQKHYGPQGFQVLGIAMDDASPEDIGKFAKEMGVNYPVLLGTESVGNEYGGVQFLPTTYFVDREGKIVSRIYGLKSRSDIEDDVKTALGTQKAKN